MPDRDPPTSPSARTGVVDRVPGSADDSARGVAGPASTRPARLGPARRSSAWARFVHRYGWRAYALPVLLLITIAALLNATGTSRTPAGSPAHSVAPQAPPTAPGNISLKSDQPSGSSQQQAIAAAALPAGAGYTTQGAGTFRTLPGTSAVTGRGTLFRYTIDVENGITGVDLTQFASVVDKSLADPRSWSGHGVALQRVSSGSVDFHITLTSSMTVRKLCGYDIAIETSCYSRAGSTSAADSDRVVLNDARWVRGSAAYLGDISTYQIYLVNHETGHALGHQHAHTCLPGGLAPVMMQQTIGLRSAGSNAMCQANPWPYPPGAAGAPGVEAPDTPQNSELTLGHD